MNCTFVTVDGSLPVFLFVFTKEEATLTTTLGIGTLAYNLTQRCCLLAVIEESMS